MLSVYLRDYNVFVCVHKYSCTHTYLPDRHGTVVWNAFTVESWRVSVNAVHANHSCN